MATIKHSKRTFRPTALRFCQHCKTQVFYLGHDTMRSGNWLCNKSWCEGYNQRYRLVYLNSDATLHVCADGTVPEVEGGNAEEAEEPSTAIATPAPKPAAAHVNGHANGTAVAIAPDAQQLAMQQLQAALGVLVAPNQTVDAETVRRIVAGMVPEMIGDAVMATVPVVVEAATKYLKPVVQLEVKGLDGTVHKIEGLSHSVLPKLLRILGTGKHVFLPGPAGTGKSHMARQAAEALGKPFYAVSVGPTMLESKLLGYMDAKGDFISTVFYEWCKSGGIFLLDEVDNGNPSVLNVMNSALANKFVTFPNGEMIELHPDCVCLAAGNTFGTGPDRAYVGRQALDAAFLNRFVFLEVPIDENLEEQLCLGTGLEPRRVTLSLEIVRKLRRNIARLKLPIVMGPRNAEAFCALLAVGFTGPEASDMALRKGLSDADWRKISDD